MQQQKAFARWRELYDYVTAAVSGKLAGILTNLPAAAAPSTGVGKKGSKLVTEMTRVAAPAAAVSVHDQSVSEANKVRWCIRVDHDDDDDGGHNNDDGDDDNDDDSDDDGDDDDDDDDLMTC